MDIFLDVIEEVVPSGDTVPTSGVIKILNSDNTSPPASPTAISLQEDRQGEPPSDDISQVKYQDSETINDTNTEETPPRMTEEEAAELLEHLLAIVGEEGDEETCSDVTDE